MAKRRQRRGDDSPGFFERHEREEAARFRRQRALFIPHILKDAAANKRLGGDAQDRAYQIAVKWADLESGGHLAEYKETTLDKFLDQLFGEGLGYRHKSDSPDAFELDHKYYVKDVGTADGALGEFPKSSAPSVMIELKDANKDLDRDRSNGRTAVQQCWDYLNAVPSCPWGIVSNFKTIRLYHREKGNQTYEEFTLQELRRRERFNEFYCVFQRDGLLPSLVGQKPRALDLLRQTAERQKAVGDDLYKSYQWQRLRLIEHLMTNEHKSLDGAIRLAQKLLDRIIFIAFCEDRDLLEPKSLERAWTQLPAFTKARNPRWQAFLALFGDVDSDYNGLLFKNDPELDELDLEDEPWSEGLKNFGTFDFSEEVNVEVLGHIFERSITELEKLRIGGLYALKANIENGNGDGAVRATKAKKKPAADDENTPLSKMPKSAQRKRFGIYYTPPAFTGLIVERTVDALVNERFQAIAKEHKIDPEARKNQDPKKLLAYWNACLEELKTLTVCDPACGSGAFLIRAYESLEGYYKTVIHNLAGAGMPTNDVAKLEDTFPELILDHNLYGVDLSQEAVEITQLALWIRTARRDHKLSDLSKHIVCGNSLVNDKDVDPKALNWAKSFPTIFGRGKLGGFSCVIGNPPWERVKLQNREFFSLSAPDVLYAFSPEVARCWFRKPMCHNVLRDG